MNGGETAGRCRNCGGAAPIAATGRPRLYCSQACRQAAYRGRRAAGGKQAAADAAQARELARTLAAAARDLARAVADPAAGDATARKAATRATAALAALTGLTGLGGLPICDETPVPVTEPGSAIAGSGRGAGQEHPGTAAAAALCGSGTALGSLGRPRYLGSGGIRAAAGGDPGDRRHLASGSAR